MLRKLNSLIPPALKRLDHQLLLHEPTMWATRVHYVLCVAGGIFALLGMRIWLMPVQLHALPIVFTYGVSMSLLAIAIYVVWAWRANRFNVENQFGENSLRSELMTQAAYIGGTLLLTAMPLSSVLWINSRIDTAIDTQQFVSDVNAYNLGNSFFSTSEYELENNKIDSQRTIAFSAYLRDEGYNAQIISSTDSLRHPRSRAAQLALITDYTRVFYTYTHFRIPFSSEEILKKYRNNEFISLREFDDAKNQLYDNFNAIEAAKNSHRLLSWKSEEMFSIGFTGLFAALLLIIFVKSPLLTFGLSLITGAGVLMAFGVMAAVGNVALDLSGNQEENYLLFVACLIFAFMFLQAFRQKNTLRLHRWKQICLTLVAVATPVFPIAFAAVWRFDDYYNSTYQHQVIQLVFIASALIGFAAWNIFYRPRFRQIQAQPKDN